MIAPLTIYQANLSNQDFPYLFTFHKLFYMNHIYTCERRNCAKLSSDRLSSDESFAFPSSGDCCYVSYLNFMPQCCSVSPFETRSSYGTHLLNHLAADGTGLAGGQVAVVALLEVDADLPWCVFTTKTQFYFEVNTHQGGLMFFDLLKICYPCYIPYRVFCDFSNKAVKDTNTLPVGSSRPSNR